MNEKRIRDAAVLGALHGIVFENEVELTNTPRFDGGVRGDAFSARSDPTLGPSLRPPVYREPGGWHTVEIEDGADLFFGQLGER